MLGFHLCNEVAILDALKKFFDAKILLQGNGEGIKIYYTLLGWRELQLQCFVRV